MVQRHAGAVDRAQTAIPLRRDLELLEVLAGNEALVRGGLGVARLAQLVERDKGQISRALRALEAEGLVERDPETLEYRLGWRIYALAARTGESRLVHTAVPLLRSLVASLGETVHLCVLRGNAVLTLLSEASPHAFRAFGWEGRGVPVTCTSAGRVLLLDSTLEDLRLRLSEEDFAPGGPAKRIHSVEDLYREILAIRRIGYALVDEELEVGLVGASAPVYDFRGRIVAAINVSAPKERVADRLDEIGRATAASAGNLSHQMGWSRAVGVAQVS